MAAYGEAGLAGGADFLSAARAMEDRKRMSVAIAIGLRPARCERAAMDGAPGLRGWAGCVGWGRLRNGVMQARLSSSLVRW